MNRPTHGGNLNWASTIAGCSVSEITDFSASINPSGPPQSALAAIGAGLSKLAAYPDPTYQRLRENLGRWHDISPDWILPGNGSAELLTWACRELAQLDHTCLLTPAFSDYRRALESFGGKIKTHPLTLEKNITFNFQSLSESTSGGLLLNNPHNPTGKLFTVEEIIPYLHSFSLVVIDEAFMDFVPPEGQQSFISRLPEYDNLVILRSLTKFYSIPGLRVGYALSHPKRLSLWQKWRDPWPVSILAEEASIACIQDRVFQDLTHDWLLSARENLFSRLTSIPYLTPFPGSANFLLVRSQISCLSLQEYLLKEHKIYIRDCLSFRELGESYFRIAVRTEEDNNRLVSALLDYFR